MASAAADSAARQDAFRRRRAAYMRGRRANKSTASQLRKESWEHFLKRRGEKYAVRTPHAVLPDPELLAVYYAAVVPPGTRMERWMQRVWNAGRRWSEAA
jgi:hypothetical protein